VGWDINSSGDIICRSERTATQLIYPTHLKYDQTQKLPYSALISRLRQLLLTTDTLLITCGFSFSDAHLTAVIEESLSANRSAAVIALLFGTCDVEEPACKVASRHANMSVYARDGAIINCIQAPWQPADSPPEAWIPIRASFWGQLQEGNDSFLLGDFSYFARYVALTRAEQTLEPEEQNQGEQSS
jgi:hypothetical protein